MTPPPPDRYPLLLNPRLTTLQPGRYALKDPKGGQHVTIDAPMLTLLAAFDGQRTCAQIAAALEGSALAMLYDEDFVCAFAEALAERDLVQLLDAPGQRPSPLLEPTREILGAEPLRHRCVGCGRSCEGHHIGPLDQAFLERLPDIATQLDVETTDLLMEHRGEQFLAMTSEFACVFLGPNRLCRIHAQLGAHVKPLVCRLFPIQIVDTERGLRVTSTRCFEAHQSWEPEPPGRTPVLTATIEAITGVPISDIPTPDIRGLNPRAPLVLAGDFAPRSIEHRTYTTETRLDALFSRQDASLPEFLAALLNEPLTDAPHPLHLPSPLDSDLTAFARTLAARKKQELDASVARPGSTIAVLLEVVDAVERFEPFGPRPISARELAYGWHVARQWFHARNWQHHPSLLLSGALIAFGLALSAWRASQDLAPDDDTIRERFAHTLVGWVRLIASRDVIVEMFQHPAPLA